MLETVDARLAAQLWQHRFRGALVATIHKAGDAGAPEEDVALALARFMAETRRLDPDGHGVSPESVEAVVRSLYVDGLLVREAGRVKLGPNFKAYMKRWSEQRVVAANGVGA